MKYYVKNKNVSKWFNWKELIIEYMKIKPIKGFVKAIKRIILSR